MLQKWVVCCYVWLQSKDVDMGGYFFKKNTIVYEESQFIFFLKWSEEQVKSQHEFWRPGHEGSEVALQGPVEEEGGSRPPQIEMGSFFGVF